MRPYLKTFLMAVVTCALAASSAAAEKLTPGPRGGKLLEGDGLRAEFFIEKDHTVSVSFYDANLKPVPAKDEVVSATAEAPAGKTKLEFSRKGDMLVSTAPLPHGENYNIVVQLKRDASSKPQNFRVKFDTHLCGECQRAEYACTCEH